MSIKNDVNDLYSRKPVIQNDHKEKPEGLNSTTVCRDSNKSSLIKTKVTHNTEHVKKTGCKHKLNIEIKKQKFSWDANICFFICSGNKALCRSCFYIARGLCSCDFPVPFFSPRFVFTHFHLCKIVFAAKAKKKETKKGAENPAACFDKSHKSQFCFSSLSSLLTRTVADLNHF